MGADTGKVLFEMSKEYLMLIVISLLISIPVGWIVVGKLLEQFPVRVEMNILVFAAIAAGAIVIAMFTVSFQAYKAAGINPAESLKIE
jgi:putative ABC transport system permease protein